MVRPERANDEVVDSGVWFVPGIMVPIVLGLEVHQASGLDTDPLSRDDHTS